jgi:hypothetical protein
MLLKHYQKIIFHHSLNIYKMKNRTKVLTTWIALSILILSCQNEQFIPINKFDSSIFEASTDSRYKRIFGKSFSKALVADTDLRAFIKSRALKMMNYDYDIPYHLVKHEKLANGKSFRETLLPYFNNEEELATIEQTQPLLTIFVPSLPEKSFSAEKWNTETEIPHVAMRLVTANDIPVIDTNGEEYLIDSELIPSYPIVVIKDNERLISEVQDGFKETKSTRVLTSDGIKYKFVDDIFDKELQAKNNSANQRSIISVLVDRKLVDAYNIYQNNDGWQRDYIYYNITPSSPNGQFSYDFQEHIRSFKFTTADAITAYLKIAEQDGDPRIKTGKESSGWTDGFFEIRANVLIQSQNGIGATIPAKFLTTGAELFNVTYVTNTKGVWPFRYTYYNISTVTANSVSTNIPIINWDLNNYASTLRIDVEEVDNPTETTESVSETVKFATNFSIEGVIKKIGLKFGASLERTTANVVQRKYTLASDELGTVIVNFADKVILSRNSITTRTREYNNGIFSISVEPKNVTD